MGLIGSDFSKFPMGGRWAQVEQDERDQYIRLMLSRLDVYGVTDDRKYSDVELGALSVYVRRLFEQEGADVLEPPDFVTNSLEAQLERAPPPFLLSAGSGLSAFLPAIPPAGEFILSSQDGRLAWFMFPIPQGKAIIPFNDVPQSGDFVAVASGGLAGWISFPIPEVENGLPAAR